MSTRWVGHPWAHPWAHSWAVTVTIAVIVAVAVSIMLSIMLCLQREYVFLTVLVTGALWHCVGDCRLSKTRSWRQWSPPWSSISRPS